MLANTTTSRNLRPIAPKPIVPQLGADEGQVVHVRGRLSTTPNLVDMSGSEHYIHSRLKSILPSGPKEQAQAYTGVVATGNSLRRMASVNAEARTKLVYTSDYNTGPKNSPHVNGHDGISDPMAASPSTVQVQVGAASTTLPSTGGSIIPPVKSPSKSPIHMKDSYVQVVDVRKSQQRRLFESSSSSPSSVPNSPSCLNISNAVTAVPPTSQGPVVRSITKKSRSSSQPAYIKRIAAVNARACVHAIMGYEYLTKKREIELRNVLNIPRSSPSTDDSVLGKRPASQQPGNSNQNNSKKKENLKSPSTGRKQTASVPIMQSGSAVGSAGSSQGSSSLQVSNEVSDDGESVSSSNGDHEESSGYYSFESDQQSSHNCLGLLYNSDTLHTKAFIYLTTEGQLPSLLIPPIIPKKYHETKELKSRILEKPIAKKRSRKGDNGWITIGDSIKTIEIKHKGGGHHERNYFIGIQRKDESVFVRDSITVRSGHKKSDIPYVAKVGSIWQESDGIIITAFWYYRPDDVEQHTAALFTPSELMASQHHDDIGVACIDGKCKVVGYTEFCRYRANEERINAGCPPSSVVPPFDHSLSKSEYQQLSKRRCVDESNDDDDEEEEEDSVYFCYRAYNHITGRVLK